MANGANGIGPASTPTIAPASAKSDRDLAQQIHDVNDAVRALQAAADAEAQRPRAETTEDARSRNAVLTEAQTKLAKCLDKLKTTTAQLQSDAAGQKALLHSVSGLVGTMQIQLDAALKRIETLETRAKQLEGEVENLRKQKNLYNFGFSAQHDVINGGYMGRFEFLPEQGGGFGVNAAVSASPDFKHLGARLNGTITGPVINQKLDLTLGGGVFGAYDGTGAVKYATIGGGVLAGLKYRPLPFLTLSGSVALNAQATIAINQEEARNAVKASTGAPEAIAAATKDLRAQAGPIRDKFMADVKAVLNDPTLGEDVKASLREAIAAEQARLSTTLPGTLLSGLLGGSTAPIVTALTEAQTNILGALPAAAKPAIDRIKAGLDAAVKNAETSANTAIKSYQDRINGAAQNAEDALKSFGRSVDPQYSIGTDVSFGIMAEPFLFGSEAKLRDNSQAGYLKLQTGVSLTWHEGWAGKDTHRVLWNDPNPSGRTLTGDITLGLRGQIPGTNWNLSAAANYRPSAAMVTDTGGGAVFERPQLMIGVNSFLRF